MMEEKITKEEMIIKEILRNQKKVKIKIPKDSLNKEDMVIPVGINGYFYYINRGKTVEVPEEVARILEEGNYI